MSTPDQSHPPRSTLPLAGRVAKLAAKPRSGAREGGERPRSLAKKLRASPTLSEIRLWHVLHALRTNGYHFRKQVKLGSYYVDFACLHASVVIEVDGITHHSERAQTNDATRDDYLRGRGFTVLRFASDDVMRNEFGVGESILAALAGRTRNHRGSRPPSQAPLGPEGPSSATLPARGEGGTGAGGPNKADSR